LFRRRWRWGHQSHVGWARNIDRQLGVGVGVGLCFDDDLVDGHDDRHLDEHDR
jgi:hypothetical protein